MPKEPTMSAKAGPARAESGGCRLPPITQPADSGLLHKVLEVHGSEDQKDQIADLEETFDNLSDEDLDVLLRDALWVNERLQDYSRSLDGDQDSTGTILEDEVEEGSEEYQETESEESDGEEIPFENQIGGTVLNSQIGTQLSGAVASDRDSPAPAQCTGKSAHSQYPSGRA
eukprot:sb/3472105/